MVIFDFSCTKASVGLFLQVCKSKSRLHRKVSSNPHEILSHMYRKIRVIRTSFDQLALTYYLQILPMEKKLVRTKTNKGTAGQMHIPSARSLKRGITHSKFDGIWRNTKMICGWSLQSHIQYFSSISRTMTKKSCGKLNCYNILSLKKGHNSFKIWRKANLICGSSI